MGVIALLAHAGRGELEFRDGPVLASHGVRRIKACLYLTRRDKGLRPSSGVFLRVDEAMTIRGMRQIAQEKDIWHVVSQRAGQATYYKKWSLTGDSPCFAQFEQAA